MNHFFEALFSVVIALVVTLLCAQGVMTNTEISTAREYHNTVIERLENTGLSEEYMESIVEYTNSKTDYTLTIDEVEGTDDTRSYRVSLKYPIKNAIYRAFGMNQDKYAIVDGYASIGKSSPSTSAISYEKHGNTINTIDMGENVSATLYEDGYLIVSGTGNSITITSDNLNSVKKLATNIVVDDDNLKVIPTGLFKNFSSLEGINTGKVETIESNAFSNCTKLKTALLNKYVKTVKENAFANCTSLEYIYINNTSSNVAVNANVYAGCTQFKDTVFMKN